MARTRQTTRAHPVLRLPQTREALVDLFLRGTAVLADPAAYIAATGSLAASRAFIEEFLDGEARRQPAVQCGEWSDVRVTRHGHMTYEHVSACQRRTRHPSGKCAQHQERRRARA